MYIKIYYYINRRQTRNMSLAVKQDSSKDTNFQKNNESIRDDLDDWFNDMDDKTIEIINKDLIKEDPAENDDEPEQYITPDGNNNISAETEYIYVEDILTKDLNDLSSNEIIQYECSIAYFIQVLIEGTNINKIKTLKTYDSDLTDDKITDIIIYLKWISNACEILTKRINQEVLVYVPDLKPSIVRSSYNFCTKYTQCKNFYSKQEAPNCKEHHYVHSLLKYDIDSVIYFLQYVTNNNIILEKDDLNNLYLSIKTICFVTRHMSKEISYIDYITKNNSENFHRNNPIDLSKKKNLFRTMDKNMYNQNYKPDHNYYKQNHYQPNDKYNKQTYPKYRNIKPRFDRAENNRRESHNQLNKQTNTLVNNKPLAPVEKNINRYSVLSDF